MMCNCGHRAICHRYMVTTRTNGGECLSSQCPCTKMVDEA